MALIADMFLVAGALGATFYCFVLSRRLNRFTDLENGVGGAIATLSAQVEDMTRTLKSAQGAATASASSLEELTGRAEDAARRLELLVASMHDLPPAPSKAVPTAAKKDSKPAADAVPANNSTAQGRSDLEHVDHAAPAGAKAPSDDAAKAATAPEDDSGIGPKASPQQVGFPAFASRRAMQEAAE